MQEKTPLMQKTIKHLMNFGIGCRDFFLKIVRNKRGRLGLAIVLAIVLISIFAPILTPYSIKDFNPANGLQHPSASHWLGTDKNGVDILTQLLYGARVSLKVGVLTGICVTLAGACLGIISAYFGKVSSTIILSLINVLLVVPTLPLMMILSKVSSSYYMMILIFTLLGWPGTARMIRAQVLSLCKLNYIKSAELSGAGKGYVMFKHIMPAIGHLLIMNCCLSCAGFMIAEAGLSFIGLGDPSAMSWGKILVAAEQDAFSSSLWAWIIAPGVAIFITVTGFIQMGYAIEEILNPKFVSKKAKKSLMARQTPEEVFAEMKDLTPEEAETFKRNFEGGQVHE